MRALVGLALLALALGPGAGAAERERAFEDCSLSVGGRERTFRLHVPSKLVAGKAMPVVFVLHGGGGRASAMPRQTRGTFERLADRDGWLVVYPQGFEKGWNDGRADLNQPASLQNVDDIGFFSKMLESLSSRFSIDPGRIYGCGISNGGFMSHRLACELSDRFAAVAAVDACVSKTLSETRKPSRPVPVLMILGSDDPLVPFAGGQVGTRRRPRGEALSAAESVRFWLERNGCSSTPVREELPDRDPEDGTRSFRTVYSGPGARAVVELLTVQGGGHTWPGGRQYLPEFLIGKVCRDFDAAEVIWDFFARHPRL